jgi:N-acetylated-alpha-linked acidic dipeptidase
MRTLFSSLLISATGLALAPLPADAPPRGFFPQSVQAERDLETRFKTMPDPAHMREAMRRLSARPHHVGSPYDKDNAEWILAQFKSYGWDAHIENFDVLFPTPVDRVVELVSPTTFKASLQETALPNDPTSNQQSEQLPSYNA